MKDQYRRKLQVPGTGQSLGFIALLLLLSVKFVDILSCSGGWMESTQHDTAAFNLQTKTIFIDMRFPTNRPIGLNKRACLRDCSDLELRILSRQHCFSGYTFPEKKALVFTRHHIVDWNFHPSFPRSRPNRWWVEIQPVDRQSIPPIPHSFKEFSTIRDENDVPLYFERWQRMKPFRLQNERQVVLWRPGNAFVRTAVLVIVGEHFSFCVDRDYSSATNILNVLSNDRESRGHACRGGGGLFVDFLLDSNGRSAENDYLIRQAAEDYLSLIGDYGIIGSDGEANGGSNMWQIVKSTHPWREGRSLIRPGDISWKEEGVVASDAVATDMVISWADLGDWEVFESSLKISELEQLFQMREFCNFNRSKLYLKYFLT